MATCRHRECHDPANCQTCSTFGNAWCDHQDCRHSQTQGAPAGQAPSGQAATDPVREGTALLLKIAFGLGAVLMVWLLARGGRSQEGEPWDPLGSAGPADFSPWTPAQ